MDDALAAHRVFWLAEHNPARTGQALRGDSTITDHHAHLRAFATYAEEHFGNVPPNPLALLADAKCSSLTTWLDSLSARGVGSGTRAGYCNSAISYLKVVAAVPGSAAAVEFALAGTQRIRSALQKQYDAERRAGRDREALANRGKYADWDDITEATRELVRQWRDLERMLATQTRGGDTEYYGNSPRSSSGVRVRQLWRSWRSSTPSCRRLAHSSCAHSRRQWPSRLRQERAATSSSR
jgi:hypothetical protein